MRQFFGFLIVLIALPALWFINNLLNIEITSAKEFHSELNSTIVLDTPTVSSPVTLKDRNGQVFSEEYVEWRQQVPLDDIPSFLQQSFIQTEDTNFLEHRGFDIAAIVRAFLVNSTSNDIEQGASTITQQLVRMRYLSTEKTYERKATELLYAYELEKQHSKRDILEMYLNEMYFGNLVYGVGAASTYYFGKTLSELNEGELAFLSAIPNNPTLYNPLTNFEKTKARQELIIDVLSNAGIITTDEATSYKELPIQLTIKQKKNTFPSYSTYVFHELNELISIEEGFDEKLANAKDSLTKDRIHAELNNKIAEVIASGIVIETSLDQEKMKRDQIYFDKKLTIDGLQAGSVVIDNETREIVSLYAGKNYEKYNFNRAYQALRQPGSAIKPLLVYAPLFETTSYSADSIINGGNFCIGTYCPKNYGGAVYGNVSIRQAFRHSHNTTAVKTMQKVGIEEAFSLLNRFNFSSISEKDFSYPSALGGFHTGVSVLEMADAYTGFIDGSYKPAHAIRKVKNLNGETLYEWHDEAIEVWSPHTVETIRDLLGDVVRHGTGRKITDSTSYIGAKTGTTDDYHDYWIAGLNENYTAAVWIGYDQPKNLKFIQQYQLQHQLFSALMKK